MTFRQWLKKQERRDDPVGDLARDMAQDKTFPPPRFNSVKTTVNYLRGRNACEGAETAAIRAWREYEEAEA